MKIYFLNIEEDSENVKFDLNRRMFSVGN